MGEREKQDRPAGPGPGIGSTPEGTARDPEPAGSTDPENLILGEVQLILAEKRTALAVMRAGIAVFVLPLSVFSLLIATSKYYEIVDVLHLFALVLGICLGLVILGAYLVIRSVRRMHRYDLLITSIKKRHSRVSEFLD